MSEMSIGDNAEYIMDHTGVYHPCTDAKAREGLEEKADKVHTHTPEELGLGTAAEKDYTETVEQSSAKLITSGGVYEAIKGIYDSLGNISVIKSIQRGTAKGKSEDENIQIPISAVDPNKCMVLLDNSMIISGGVSSVRGAYVISLEETMLTISPNGTRSGGTECEVGWQVIEFR